MANQRFKTLHEFVQAARLNLNQTHWDYLIGGTETETTLKRNRLAIDSLALMPRVLRDVSEVDPSTALLGQALALPVVLAPLVRYKSLTPWAARPLLGRPRQPAS